MKRLHRLTALLSYLQANSYVSMAALQDRFNMSERTLYRDLNALDEAGVPIAFEPQKGYFILEKHFIPPLAFTQEEAQSFIFMEQLARKYTDPATFKTFSGALEKIRNKLQRSQLEALEKLESNVLAYVDADYTPKYLQLAEQALNSEKVVHLRYQDMHGNLTERTVEPIGISFYGQAWHLIGYCRLRQAYRDFSLARTKVFRITEEFITEKRLTLQEYIAHLEKEQLD